jgi:hypothetical protein
MKASEMNGSSRPTSIEEDWNSFAFLQLYELRSITAF